MQYHIKDNVLSRDVDGDYFVFNPDKATINAFTETGNRIWHYMCNGMSLSEIIENMVQEYDVSRDTLERDCKAFLRMLEEKGYISITE
jgi:hypothetical protein